MEGIEESPPVLCEEVTAYFEKLGLISPVNGKRKISTALLATPSSIPSRSEGVGSTQISSTSFNTAFESQEVDDVEIPANLYSAETYAFLGFTSDMAHVIFERYQKYSDEDGDDFFDYARYHITESISLTEETEAERGWKGLMDRLGINQRLQTAIMLPEFEDVRHTASCKFWLVDSMRMAFVALEKFNDELRKEMACHQHAGGLVPNLEGGKRREAVLTAPIAMENHTMLWRGGSHASNMALYNQGTGELDLDAVASTPGDFSGMMPVTYFSTQRQTADHYAAYAKHRANLAKVSILQIAVPHSLKDRLSVLELHCDPRPETPARADPVNNWEKVVWYSRRGKRLPKELAWIDKKDVLVGECARSMNVAFKKMRRSVGKTSCLSKLTGWRQWLCNGSSTAEMQKTALKRPVVERVGCTISVLYRSLRRKSRLSMSQLEDYDTVLLGLTPLAIIVAVLDLAGTQM